LLIVIMVIVVPMKTAGGEKASTLGAWARRSSPVSSRRNGVLPVSAF
jgi:hypothetical protein